MLRLLPAALIGASLVFNLAEPATAARLCAGLVVASPEPGERSAVVDVVIGDSAMTNTEPVATPDQAVHATSLTCAPDGSVYAVDPDADPAGWGPDPGGGRGRGGLFLLDATSGNFSLVSDGTNCDSSIENCPAGGAFVDPHGLAFDERSNTLLIVDSTADPSGFGTCRNGGGGHGAVFSTVCSTTDRIYLVADGSDYPAGIPDGRASIFENPVAAALCRSGVIYIADSEARLDPAGGVGAIFRVGLNGTVELVAAEADFASLRDIAVGPDGLLMVLDDTGTGRIFEIDPDEACGSNTLQRITCTSLVKPTALAIAGNGDTYVLDSDADPLEIGAQGAVFQLESNGGATLVSSTRDFVRPVSLALLSSVSLDEAAPDAASPGAMVTVWLNGGPFDTSSVADFGEDIEVLGTHVLTSSTLEIDLVVGADAMPGLRDISVRNSRQSEAFHCDLFEVSGGSFCASTAPVAATLRMSHVDPLDGGLLRLDWAAPEDPCLDTFAAYRSFTPVPSGSGGSWPVDPWFIDMRPAELDGSLGDERATFLPVHGRAEYFLVVPVGTNGQLGPLGHY